jgi:hypothetical protein
MLQIQEKTKTVLVRLLKVEDIIFYDSDWMKVVSITSCSWSWSAGGRSIMYGRKYTIRLAPSSEMAVEYQWSDRSKADWDLYWRHAQTEAERIQKQRVTIERSGCDYLHC